MNSLGLDQKPTWSFSLDPSFSFQFQVLTAPNGLYRFLQRVVLGIHWKRIEY